MEGVDDCRPEWAALPGKKLRCSEALVTLIKQTEKRTFPAKEAMDFDAEMKKRNTQLYCAYREDSGVLVLYGYLVYVRSKLVTRIHKVCVVEQHRGKGLGAWMMGRAVEELRKGGAADVDLWVDLAREPARRLYRGCGFEDMEVVRDYYGAGRDAVRMQRNL